MAIGCKLVYEWDNANSSVEAARFAILLPFNNRQHTLV
jgi:hypothetical protein